MRRVLVTGGAGFIGTNIVAGLVRDGCDVTAFDNLSRRGAETNLAWLRSEFGGRVSVIEGDVRDFATVEKAVTDADTIFHLAAQVAVTASVTDPRSDFEINALGSLHVLEAARQAGRRPTIVFTSTNKVYGEMTDVPVVADGKRYRYASLANGIAESRNLDFHSPYGCSKGAADQYVRDYARIYGLRTVVLRMSCIYGPHQHGNEDQGWVAHFAIRALQGQPITIYGDGRQVRDALFVNDLVAAFRAVIDVAERQPFQVYNVGGGTANTVSLLELVAMLESEVGRRMRVDYAEWRPGDQRVYISDIGEIGRATGWRPRVGVEEGVRRLLSWLRDGVVGES